MRILWQSFLDPTEHEPYVTLLRQQLTELGGGEVEFDVVGILPPDRYLHALTELRCGIATIRNAVYAERSGYDAVVIGHFQEPGLLEARATLDIPVIGLGEASLLHACTLGRKLGLVTIDPVFVPWHEAQVRAHGLEQRVVGICSLQVAPDAFMAAMRPGPSRDELLARFETAVEPLLAAGAEVVIPAGALPAIALCTDGNLRIGGAPVLHNVAVTALQARAAVELRRKVGTEASRRSAFGKPPQEAVDEFLAATGGPPQAPPR